MEASEFRSKILEYMETVDKSSLIFGGYESPNDEFDSGKYSVLEMVKRCLYLMTEYPSVNADTKVMETSAQRNRSSWDIWRHIKYFYPEITIFQVMAALYENREGNMFSLSCCDIERRVFRHYNYTDVILDGELDEFGVKFYQWVDIDPNWTVE